MTNEKNKDEAMNSLVKTTADLVVVLEAEGAAAETLRNATLELVGELFQAIVVYDRLYGTGDAEPVGFLHSQP